MQALEALRHSLFLFVSTLTGSVKNLLTPIWERVVFGVKNIADWTFFGLESFWQATFSRLVFWGEKMQDALIGQSLISFALLILSILLGWLLVKIVRNLFLNLKLLDLKEKVELFFEKNNKKITKKSKENIFSKLKNVLVFSQKKSQHNFEFVSKEQKKIILKKQREASGHIFIATKYPALASSALVLFAMLCYSLPEKYQLASLMQSVEMRQAVSKNATGVNQVGDYPLNQDLINQTPTKNEKIIAKSNAGQEMVLAETDVNLSADNQSAISSDSAKAMADKTADQSKKTILLTGVLTDNNGQPVTGEYVARFAIYTKDRENIDPYPSDTDKNSRIWEENQTITFKKGLFSVSLGAKRDLPVFTNLDSSQFYIGMRIGTDSEMAPRKKVSTPFFALNSANSVLLNGKKVGLDAGDIIALNENGQVNLENLPIGTKKDQLVLGSDKRLKMTVSGASFVALSGQELTISKVNLTSDIEVF